MSNSKKNVEKAIIYVAGSNFIAGLIFILLYANGGSMWFLLAGFLMGLAATAFIFLAKKFQKKLDTINNSNSTSKED